MLQHFFWCDQHQILIHYIPTYLEQKRHAHRLHMENQPLPEDRASSPPKVQQGLHIVSYEFTLSDVNTLIKMRKKFLKYTIVIRVQPKYTLTFLCIYTV
jgi:hypothetical protein